MPVPKQNPTDEALASVEGPKVVTTDKARDIDSEGINPRLRHTDTSDRVVPPRHDEPIKALPEPSGDVFHTAVYMIYQETRILNPIRPLKSSFIPCSKMMYYYIHEFNKLMVHTKTFIENAGPFHPLLINLGYGVIFCIQVLRCQHAAGDITLEDEDLLQKFLSRFPPNRIPIPGFLVTLFQSISNSQPPVRKMGIIYPKMPQVSMLKRHHVTSQDDKAYEVNNGAFLPTVSNWFIPNIPLMIGFLRYLTSDDTLRQLADRNQIPNVFDYTTIQNVAGVHIRPTIHGYQWPSLAPPDSPEQMWLLTSCGIEHRCPATKSINQNFIITGRDLIFPSYTINDHFADLRDYLGFTSGFEWFGNILPILDDYCSFSKSSSTLANCPIDASAACQVEIHYMRPETNLIEPRYQGDVSSILKPVFKASTISTITSRTDELSAFVSQINVTYPKEFAPIRGFARSQSLQREGPYWNSSNVKYTTQEDGNYILAPTVLKKMFHVVKPEK